MIKNIWGVAVFCAMSLLAFTACDDEHNSVLPAFGGFRSEPTVWYAGDSVTVVAVQQSLGDLIFRAKYTWRVDCNGTALADTTYTVVYDNDKSDPLVGFRIPDGMSGNATIGFKAEYSYSATAPKSVASGTNDGKSGLFGNIRTTASSELYGQCSGTASHVITVPR